MDHNLQKEEEEDHKLMTGLAEVEDHKLVLEVLGQISGRDRRQV